jgi:RNA polymerase sigma factor (sigma-70 family)
MGRHIVNAVWQYLRKTVRPPAADEVSDADLLTEYVQGRAEAFDQLVQRHGRMVFGVARRILQNDHDAEDAFQAAFLVLTQKARSLRQPNAAANWLYGTACRAAWKMRTTAARRRRREIEAAAMTREETPTEGTADALRPVLDEEINRLPAGYRLPVVLCHLEGRSAEEAARQLRCSAGAVRKRLMRARGMLGSRLERRGVALAGAGLGLFLEQQSASADLPASVAARTVEAAARLAAGVEPGGVVSATAGELIRGVLRDMAMVKYKVAALLFLPLLLLGAGAGLAAHVLMAPTNADDAPPSHAAPEKKDRNGDSLPAGAWFRLGSECFNHGGKVATLVFAPDGKTLVSGGDSGVKTLLRFWDASTGKEIRALWGETLPQPISGGLPAQAQSFFSADGQTMATQGLTKNGEGLWETHRWEVSTGKKLKSFKDNLAAFSPDGKFLALFGEHTFESAGVRYSTQTIQLWEADTGKKRTTINSFGSQAFFSPDSKILATWSWNSAPNPIRLLDVATGKELQTCLGEPLMFSPDAKILASTVGKQIWLWDVAKGAALRKFKFERTGQNAFAGFTPEGKPLALRNEKGAARLLDLDTDMAICSFEAQPTFPIRLSPDGKTLASGSEDGRIHVWDLATGKERHPYSNIGAPVFSPDGKTLAFTSSDATIRLWDVVTRKEVQIFSGHKGNPHTTSFSPDGKLLASAGADERIRLWDVAAGKEVRTLPGKGCSWVVFTPDGKTLISQEWLQEMKVGIRLWNVATGEEIGTSKPGQLSPLALAPDGTAAACIGGFPDRSIRLLDIATGKEIRTFSKHEGAVSAAAFSPDGKILASGSRGRIADSSDPSTMDGRPNRSIRLWEAATGKELFGMEAGGVIASVAFSPDGKILAAASGDNTVQLWEVATGKRIRVLTGHRGAVAKVVFSPDGKTVASGSDDRTILLWSMFEREACLTKLDARALAALWNDLASADAGRAYRAIAALAAAPQQTVPFLKERLPTRETEQLRWLRALQGLELMGGEAKPLVESLAKDAPTARLRDDAAAVLDRLARHSSGKP